MSRTDPTLPYWRLSGFYFTWAAVIGALMPYWGLYLQQRGFDEPAIGGLMAILGGTQVLAPFILGYLADRTGRRIGLIRLAIWLALLCFGGVFIDGGFGWLALVMLAFGCFWNAMAPQFEVVTLAYLRARPGHYSRIRLWGSIGFIFSVLLLGVLIDRSGPSLLPVVIAVGLALAALTAHSVRELADEPNPRPAPPVAEVLKHPAVLAFLVTGLLMHASHGPYNTFYSLYLARHDYSGTLIGLLWSLGTAAEVGAFLLMHRWLNRFSLKAIVLCSLLLAALRWLLIGTFPDQLGVLLIAQCLHAASFGSFHAAAIETIRRRFSGRLSGQGQALYSSLSVGLGNTLGAFYSGLLWQPLGAAGTFGVASLLALLGAWLYWYRHRAAQPIDPAYEPFEAN